MEIISLDNQLYVLMAAVFFLAGIIQGLFGMGLPAIGIALLSVFIPPLEAIGLNIIPIFLVSKVMNMIQMKKIGLLLKKF